MTSLSQICAAPTLLAIVFLAIFAQASQAAPRGSNRDQFKRARIATSSLIPFPRVGRSVSGGESASASSGGGFPTRNYYGQKRTGKSSLIPFPRVGRSGSNSWEVDPEILGEFDRAMDARHFKDFDESSYETLAYYLPVLKALQRLQAEENSRGL